METKPYTIQLDAAMREAIAVHCQREGLKIYAFIGQLLREGLEKRGLITTRGRRSHRSGE